MAVSVTTFPMRVRGCVFNNSAPLLAFHMPERSAVICKFSLVANLLENTAHIKSVSAQFAKLKLSININI